jgi:hypothetical protein
VLRSLAATSELLAKVFTRRRACLLIWGEGGSGKTSLACQLGRWALAEERSERLCEHVMLPVLIGTTSTPGSAANRAALR